MSLDPPELEVFLLLVLPGTELWRKAGALELTFDPEPPYPVRSHLSMTEADIAYGRRLIEAVVLLQGLRTLRLLAREPGVSFADIVDDWLAWSGPETPPASPETMRAFVAQLCARKGIPERFYQEFGALEFPAAAARIRSATRTTSAMAATP